VHKARQWLTRSAGDRSAPSDVRVSLVTGVHRNFVRSILEEPPRIAAAREQKGHRANRLLEGWHSDPKYLDSSGKPRDLSERDQEPSFHSLALTYVPGAAPSMVLEELRRAGLVQMLSEHRVRVRSRSFRLQGLNATNIDELGNRARELLETLTHNLRQPEARLFCESMASIDVDAGMKAQDVAYVYREGVLERRPVNDHDGFQRLVGRLRDAGRGHDYLAHRGVRVGRYLRDRSGYGSQDGDEDRRTTRNHCYSPSMHARMAQSKGHPDVARDEKARRSTPDPRTPTARSGNSSTGRSPGLRTWPLPGQLHRLPTPCGRSGC